MQDDQKPLEQIQVKLRNEWAYSSCFQFLHFLCVTVNGWGRSGEGRLIEFISKQCIIRSWSWICVWQLLWMSLCLCVNVFRKLNGMLRCAFSRKQLDKQKTTNKTIYPIFRSQCFAVVWQSQSILQCIYSTHYSQNGTITMAKCNILFRSSANSVQSVCVVMSNGGKRDNHTLERMTTARSSISIHFVTFGQVVPFILISVLPWISLTSSHSQISRLVFFVHYLHAFFGAHYSKVCWANNRVHFFHMK